jgi:hypothetical protein
MSKTYFTHDNYARPFKVVITKKDSDFEVKVFQETFGEATDDFGFAKSKCFLKVLSPKVFVARLNNTPYKVRQRKHFWHEDGHVVVVEVNPNEYIYIGESVYKFVVLAKFNAFRVVHRQQRRAAPVCSRPTPQRLFVH